MTEPAVWAVVPAAGVGRRMGGAVPKQYLQLRGRLVIDHTLDRLVSHPAVGALYLALGTDDGWWAGSEFSARPGVVRVEGGAERCHSVFNALGQLARRAEPTDWVLVHDAARPCLRRADLDRLIQRLAGHAVGGLLGMPVRDTMKRTDIGGQVVETVERERLWHAFTPQMFRFAVLYEALKDALDAGLLVTDEASAVERCGHRPLMVEGHADNLKITRPEDLRLADYYLEQQAREAG